GHKIRAVLFHDFDCGVVDVGTVLNRIDTGFRRPGDALRAVSVRGNFSPQAMSVGHNGLHLFQCVLRSAGIVAFGKHATRGADLDHVGAVLDDLAHLVLHSFDTVGGAVGGGVPFIGQQVLVAVTSGDGERGSAGNDPGAGDHA